MRQKLGDMWKKLSYSVKPPYVIGSILERRFEASTSMNGDSSPMIFVNVVIFDRQFLYCSFLSTELGQYQRDLKMLHCSPNPGSQRIHTCDLLPLNSIKDPPETGAGTGSSLIRENLNRGAPIGAHKNTWELETPYLGTDGARQMLRGPLSICVSGLT